MISVARPAPGTPSSGNGPVPVTKQVGERGVQADGRHGRDHRAARTTGGSEHAAEQRTDDGRARQPVPARLRYATARGGDGLGGADQPHQGLTPDEDRNGREHADTAGEEQRGRHGLVEAGLVAAAVRAGDEDAHRRADGAEGQDEDHRQAVGEADRRDGGGAEGADDDLVDDVEEEGEDELRTHRNGDAGDLTTRGRRDEAGRLGVGGQGELSGIWLNFGTGGCARLRPKGHAPVCQTGQAVALDPRVHRTERSVADSNQLMVRLVTIEDTSAGPLPCGRPRRCGGSERVRRVERAQKAPTRWASRDPSGRPSRSSPCTTAWWGRSRCCPTSRRTASSRWRRASRSRSPRCCR